jgi:hypothetical protein
MFDEVFIVCAPMVLCRVLVQGFVGQHGVELSTLADFCYGFDLSQPVLQIVDAVQRAWAVAA